VDLRLKDKVILVTGGATGIGAAIVRACSREGAIPAIVDRHTEAGEKIEKELQNGGASCRFVTADPSSSEGYALAVQEIVKTFGRIDALVNYAGAHEEVAVESQKPEEFVASLNRYLTHYYSMAHYALPHLKQSKGVIVNIVGKTNTAGQSGTPDYSCAKGAIQSLTREWAAELIAYGIRVNAIIPNEGAKRLTIADEVAAATLLLISRESAHITGQHLMMEGA
jgi:L-fucose dehydrogenase